MDSSFRANVVHLHQASGAGALEHALDRTAAEYQLHTLNLPPSPQSLDMHQPGRRAQSFQPPHPSVLTPLHSSLGSRSPSPSTWQLCSHNTPAQHPASPVSLDGFDASPRVCPQAAGYQRYPSPLLADDFAASDDQLYPALMASSGLGTPPGSINGSSTELDRQPSIFLHGSAPMPGDYLALVPHGHAYAAPPYSRGAHDEAANSRSGHSPSPPCIYSSYGMDARSPQPYQPSDLSSLPWPPAVPRNLPPPPLQAAYGHSPWGERSSVPYQRDLQESSYRCASLRCRFAASSPEQLTKHQQKHLKIHHCRFPSCSRTEGFATPNDRERHEKSIHKIPGCYWKCLDSHCSSYGKEFSRRDNLKDHLRRMHPVPEGMSESEASALRTRMADMWRFDKGSNAQAMARGRR